MSPEDRAVYRFCASHYPDLQQTWDASKVYYRAQYQKARERAQAQTEIDQQLTELHALAIALEQAAQTIRRVCYQAAMRDKRMSRPEEAERLNRRGERS